MKWDRVENHQKSLVASKHFFFSKFAGRFKLGNFMWPTLYLQLAAKIKHFV